MLKPGEHVFVVDLDYPVPRHGYIYEIVMTGSNLEPTKTTYNVVFDDWHPMWQKHWKHDGWYTEDQIFYIEGLAKATLEELQKYRKEEEKWQVRQ